MRLLLDTHVFLWLLAEPERLGQQLRRLEDSRNDLLLSAASSWEIAIKVRLGRLDLPEPPQRYVPDRMRAIGAEPLAVEHSHALAVANLPTLHRDPFDRMLVAQALHLKLTIVTADPDIAKAHRFGPTCARWHLTPHTFQRTVGRGSCLTAPIRFPPARAGRTGWSHRHGRRPPGRRRSSPAPRRPSWGRGCSRGRVPGSDGASSS